VADADNGCAALRSKPVDGFFYVNTGRQAAFADQGCGVRKSLREEFRSMERAYQRARRDGLGPAVKKGQGARKNLRLLFSGQRKIRRGSLMSTAVACRMR